MSGVPAESVCASAYLSLHLGMLVCSCRKFGWYSPCIRSCVWFALLYPAMSAMIVVLLLHMGSLTCGACRLFSQTFVCYLSILDRNQIRLDHVGSQRSALFFSGIPAGSHCGLFSFCFKQTGQCFCPLHDDAMQIRFCSKVPRNSCTHMHACWCNNFRRVSATRIMQGANLHACHQNPFADHIA